MPVPHFVPSVFPHRKPWAVALWLLCLPMCVQAQDRIYRCGNEYTNSPSQSQLKDCVVLQGGNITVVQGTRVAPKASTIGTRAASAASPSGGQPQVDPAQQKARDSDARTILTHELRRTEARLADLQREYNGGRPQAKPEEQQNAALYAQRVADLKAQIVRLEADVAGIRRELQRAGVEPPPVAAPGVAAAAASSTSPAAGSPANSVIAR